jgi:hypothetical protein
MAESRYSRTGQAVLRTADGQEIPYLLRRFVPQPTSIRLGGTVTVVQGDRLDLIAARTLGDPLLAWRIADANAAMDPSAMTAAPGRVLIFPAPQG